MIVTTGILKKRVMETLDRQDLNAYVEAWLSQAHLELQMQNDWDTQTHFATIVAEPDETFQLPPDFKAAFANMSGPGGSHDDDRIYEKNDASKHPLYVFHDGYAWTIFDNKIYVTPRPTPGDQFQLPYYRFLPLPPEDEHDWFTVMGQGYLLYESLLQAVPFLGGSDDRQVAWTSARDRSLQWLVAADVSRRYTGRSLQLTG